jgi:phage tail protein X
MVPENPQDKTVRVQKGEDWFAVAERVYGQARQGLALMQANPGVHVLHAGMWLHLPEGEEAPSSPVERHAG